MKETWMTVVWLLCCVISGSAGTAVWPGDELTITCVAGCDSVYPNSYSSFYVDPGVMQVLLQGGGWGTWYEDGVAITSGGVSNEVAINTGREKEVTFVAGGQSRTVHLKTKSVQHCLPDIEEVHFTDDKDRRQIAVGETVGIEADIDRNGCEDYTFGWEADSDVLEIENPSSTTTDIYARLRPTGGKDPTIKAVVQNNAGDRKEKSITVSVIGITPPELRLSTREKAGRTRNSIVVSRSGSTTPNEDAVIEHFYVTLYYYGDSGWQVASGKSDHGKSSEVTLFASEGDGLYEVEAYIEDSRGAVSPVAKNTVRVGVPEEGVPNLYADDSSMGCRVGEACDLGVHYDESGGGSYAIDWYDKKTGKKISGCQGTDCSINFSSPDDYVAQARIHIIGESDYNYADIAVSVS